MGDLLKTETLLQWWLSIRFKGGGWEGIGSGGQIFFFFSWTRPPIVVTSPSLRGSRLCIACWRRARRWIPIAGRWIPIAELLTALVKRVLLSKWCERCEERQRLLRIGSKRGVDVIFDWTTFKLVIVIVGSCPPICVISLGSSSFSLFFCPPVIRPDCLCGDTKQTNGEGKSRNWTCFHYFKFIFIDLTFLAS